MGTNGNPIIFYNPDLAIRTVTPYRGDIISAQEVPRLADASMVVGSYNYSPRDILADSTRVPVVNPFQYRTAKFGFGGLPRYTNDTLLAFRWDAPYVNQASDKGVDSGTAPDITPKVSLWDKLIGQDTSTRLGVSQNPASQVSQNNKLCVPCLIGWTVIIALAVWFLRRH